ncbi:protein tramtrack, alpha isoform isoform X1 [Daphnia magna]|uniref:protein tramtrack, alpha isoform isoform X1 n=1 Tax=Daphnia magna TaxID=35525 RepID=UPI0006E8A361|nr:protein tramtrack, alpha isoform isoform X1 [Daphnia magna]
MDAEEFCLRWNNHHHVLVSVLDKLLEKESMCDVTLAADHQFVRVHRLVLCACSNYFEEMLSKQADKQAFIFLKDVSFSDLRALVDYMYKGEVNVAQEQLASFLQTAEALDIKGLAYKEGDQSKSKSSQNVRSSALKRTLNESVPTSSVVSTSSNPQRNDNDASHPPIQNLSSSRPKPPPAKKAHILPSESPTNPPNTDPDDHFVVVDPKLESEIDSDHMEDQLEDNGPEWASRALDCDDDWSTSDPGMISIVPNSTREITFSSTVSESKLADNVAGPSGTQSKTNNSSSTTASRGASPVVPVKDSSIDTVQAIATTISAVSTPATVCPRCSARFSWVGAMLVHLRSNECGSLPKFTCPLPSCNFTTRHQRNIKRHVVRLHPELDYR